MNLYLLIFGEFILYMVMYYAFEQDIFSPPVMTSLVMLLATILVLPSVDVWNVVISNLTMTVIFVGLIVVGLSSLCAKAIFQRKPKAQAGTSLVITHCSRSMENAIAILSILLTLLYLVDAIRAGNANGGPGGLGSIAYMKTAYTSGFGVHMNPVIRQGFKVVMLFAYVSCFLFANNVMVLREKVGNNAAYLIALICGMAITLFSGSRTEILRLISALLLCYSILSRERSGWKRRANKSTAWSAFNKIIPLLIIFALVAFVSRTFVKLEDVGTSTDISSPLLYLSYYVGSPIQVLNIKLGYLHTLDQILFGATFQIPEFVYLGNLDYGGNVGTIFGTAYSMYGIMGMSLFLAIVYFVGSGCYYHLIGTHSTAKRNLWLVCFAYAYFVFTMSYYSNCVQELFDFSNFVELLIVGFLFEPIVYPGYLKRKRLARS